MSIPQWLQLSIVSVLWYDSYRSGKESLVWINDKLAYVCKAYHQRIEQLGETKLQFISLVDLKGFLLSSTREAGFNNVNSLSIVQPLRSRYKVKRLKIPWETDKNTDSFKRLKELLNNPSFVELEAPLVFAQFLLPLIDNKSQINSLSMSCWCEHTDNISNALKTLPISHRNIETLQIIYKGTLDGEEDDQDEYEYLGLFKSLKSLTLVDLSSRDMSNIIGGKQKFLVPHLLGNGIHLTKLNLCKNSSWTGSSFDTNDLMEYIKQSNSLITFSTNAYLNDDSLTYLLQSPKCTIMNLYLHPDSLRPINIKRPFNRLKNPLYLYSSDKLESSYYESLNHVKHVIAENSHCNNICKVLEHNTKSVSISFSFGELESREDTDKVIESLNKCTSIEYLYNHIGWSNKKPSHVVVERISKGIENHPSILNKSSWYYVRSDDIDPDDLKQHGYIYPDWSEY